jgi:hypothetical protein
MSDTNNLRPIFCANCQAVTAHELSVNQADQSEVIATCTTPECGRFHKLPVNLTAEQFADYQAKVEEANKGQVSLDKVLEQINF